MLGLGFRFHLKSWWLQLWDFIMFLLFWDEIRFDHVSFVLRWNSSDNNEIATTTTVRVRDMWTLPYSSLRFTHTNILWRNRVWPGSCFLLMISFCKRTGRFGSFHFICLCLFLQIARLVCVLPIPPYYVKNWPIYPLDAESLKCP